MSINNKLTLPSSAIIKNKISTIYNNILNPINKKDIYYNISSDYIQNKIVYNDLQVFNLIYKCQCNKWHIVFSNFNSNLWECTKCQDKIIKTLSNIYCKTK